MVNTLALGARVAVRVRHLLPEAKGFLSLGLLYSCVVQLVEHLTVNQGVAGSSPVAGAKKL